MTKNILIIDDELEICESLKMILEYENYSVDYATTGKSGLQKIIDYHFDAVLLDIQIPDLTGFEILNKISELNKNLKTIMISAHSTIENAVKATKLGAFDFIEKPIDRDKLLITVRNAVGFSKLQQENLKLKQNEENEYQIIGNSNKIKRILETAQKVAKTDARVLIFGENGTGKELIAREIHKLSSRGNKELIEVNCAAIPNELIESELFGHIKGSFTGAVKDRTGKFEQAHGSTLFLDEIGDMSLQAQAKVLKAIEEGKIEPVGGEKKIEVDVRILSATNKDLKKAIEEGRFREDLYHRLNVIPIYIPPLRERIDDIPLLVEHFTKQICEKNGFPLKKFTDSALEAFKNYEWTGNIRELKNMIERMIIMISSNEINEEDVKMMLPQSQKSSSEDILTISNTFQEFKEKAEKAYIIKKLEESNWNISKTAEMLEIQRSHLYNKMKKYKIER